MRDAWDSEECEVEWMLWAAGRGDAQNRQPLLDFAAWCGECAGDVRDDDDAAEIRRAARSALVAMHLPSVATHAMVCAHHAKHLPPATQRAKLRELLPSQFRD